MHFIQQTELGPINGRLVRFGRGSGDMYTKPTTLLTSFRVAATLCCHMVAAHLFGALWIRMSTTPGSASVDVSPRSSCEI